ncbi:MAG: sodium:proton antiporter [Verrucomicrobia bacterium]|nr:sodium:proton antiporter [Verrucomicrobiota bacterium]MBS0646090.1 sodium:proton antiporter [Verrucomicrobiota bacterium]
MIHVGLEFSIDKSNLQQYGWDYFVAFTAATLPWIFCTLYFVYFFQHELAVSQFDIWIDALLLARFAAPTSAGVLFAMMIAAGLEGTWVFKKARILAIFDDLDTIILLIPIKMMIVGFKWEIFGLLAVIFILIFLSWKKMHVLKWPIHWYWILIYSIVLVTICEGMYLVTTYLKDIYPLQLEVLLPAFVLGCMLALPAKKKGGCDFFEKDSEKKVKFLIGALFIFLVGLSMPALEISRSVTSGSSIRQILLEYKIGSLNLITVGWHVLVITFLSNLGKMFPLFCYRKEAKWKERLALSLGMCPRGEVGAGVIVLALALSLNLNHALIVIAVLSLGLNLILTGPIIILIKKLLTKPVSKIRADSGNS